ncbi:MAG: ribosome biogenesis GTPase Der [Candidatus Anoxymicrobium japonicum]|uniref:GTPase Der n=1 Tax=Candidatus Anoxymicrobium japonicum TaxID=2013648 RepID=A0A2N3G4Y0_9ACTN|nr:MAG: ribosome biogenesis GTPase Der [Candidatus Anoxymicrobium japonicum]
MPVVAILGRPNVGKSTLINRITARMTAIVDSTPGVTRDRKYVPAVWLDQEFIVTDTGGVGIEKGFLSTDIERQAFFAAQEADVVIMVVDVRTGVTCDDEWLARRLKQLKCEVLLAVNKVDNPAQEHEAYVFYSLGLGDPITISAQHGLGIGDLLDRVVANMASGKASPPKPQIAVTIVGRPNVGKSSILNKMAREQRTLVHDAPHTTRDTIDTIVEGKDREYRILDTAGIRKNRTGMSDIEYYSSLRTYKAIEDADVVLLVVDSAEGPTEHDQKIASVVESRGRASIVLLNKWDLVEDTRQARGVMDAIGYKFRYAPHLPLLRVSALTGRGIDKILPLIDTAYEEWNRRVSTPALNEFLSLVKDKIAPPRKGGRQLKLYYATQAGKAPPTVVIFVNDASLVKPDYRKFISRQLREEYGFWGSPLRVRFRTAGKDRITHAKH